MSKITLKKRAKQVTAFLCAVGLCLTGGIGALAYDGTYEHLSLYVSAGKTDGDGSLKNPFGTVEEARDYIRELKKNGEYPKNGVTVNIREGVYEITKSIEFTSEDAGTADGDIVYRAYMDEEVDFVGGLEIPISEFKKVTDEAIIDKISGVAKSAVRQYNLYEKGITREMIGEMELSGVAIGSRGLYYNDYTATPSAKLFFNNSEMTIARWPNDGYANLGEVIDKGDITRNWQDDKKGTADYVAPSDRPSYPRGFTVKIPSEKAKLWSTAPDGMIYGFFTYNWYEKADKWFYAMSGKLPMNMDVITCIYDMSLGLDDVSDGIFAVNINMNNFERLIFEENSQQYEKVYLVNSDGIIIYSNDRSMLGKNAYSYANLNTLTNEEMSDNLVHGIRVKNKMYNGMVLDNEIKMMMETDLKYYSVDTSYEKSMFLGALLFSVFITLFLSFYISMKFYKTIASIIFQIEDPLLNMGASGKNKNEVSYITANMIGMIKSNEQMENVLLDKVQMLKKAQIIALQTQLNPHFLFNTLNLVNVIVMRITKGENDAARVIRLLCDLLNVSLDTKTTIVTIGEEIEYTKKYLEIESIKYRNSFDISWKVDEKIYGFKTIKFVLQPIVENAIEHGIRFLKDKRGELDISGKTENDVIVLTVRDNGQGMTEEQTAHIVEIMNSGDIQESKNIGLANVQRRIRLIYGEKYGISISSDNNGTEVRITFPKNNVL